jgi:hypothetical protein
MGSPRTFDLLLPAVSLLMLVMLSCRARSLQIEIPHGFSGPISVSCANTGDDFQTTTVDASGKGVAATCGRTVVDTRVVRDGKTIDVDSLKWETTGDGIPLSLAFTVR